MKFFGKKKDPDGYERISAEEARKLGIPAPPSAYIPRRLEDFDLSPGAAEAILQRRAERLQLVEEIWEGLKGSGKKGHWEL